MKHVTIILGLLFTTLTFSQYKDDISVVQFSAKFLIDKQISLKKFKEFNTHTLFISEHGKFFKEEEVEYLPTIIIDTSLKLSFSTKLLKDISKKRKICQLSAR